MAPLPANCSLCNSANARLCSSCHSIAYCSAECQKFDWPLHKTICKKLTAFVATRPSTWHKLAFLFPYYATNSQLVWIACEPCVRVDADTGTDVACENALVVPLLDIESDRGNTSGAYTVLYHRQRYSTMRNFDLDHTVELTSRDGFSTDGSMPNRCIQLTTKGSAMRRDWQYPAVAMRKVGTGADAVLYEDVAAADLRVVVDTFLVSGRKLASLAHVRDMEDTMADAPFLNGARQTGTDQLE